MPLLLTAVNSGCVTDDWFADTVGATSLPCTLKLVLLTDWSAFVAVIVTVYGLLSSGAVPLQLQLPLWPPTWLTVPTSVLIVTASSTSANVPLLLTAVNSGCVTDDWLADTVGATSLPCTLKLVLLTDWSAFVAVIVTVYGLLSSGAVPLQLQLPSALGHRAHVRADRHRVIDIGERAAVAHRRELRLRHRRLVR